MRLLFTNAGRRTYLVEFALALPGVELFVADCTPFAAALHVAPAATPVLLPPVSADPAAYLEALVAAVAAHRIELLFPLSDLDPGLLAGARERLAALGCRAVVSSPEVVADCMDKSRSFAFCQRNGLPTPPVTLDPAAYPGPFPAIRKHILGSGSSGLRRVEGPADLADFEIGRDMLQPLIAGTEYGIDILNDFEGRFVTAVVKRKLAMRSGETDRAQVVTHPGLSALAQRISAAFRHVGNLDCDVLEDADGGFHCIDFNPRFGGGYPATHLAGYDYLAALVALAGDHSPRFPAAPRPITVMKGISLHWCETP